MNSIHLMVVLLIGLVEGRGEFMKVSQQFAEEAVKASVACTTKLGLPVDLLEKLLSINFADSQPMREYLYCLGVALDLTEEDGSIKRNLSKYAGDDSRKDEVIRTIDECNSDAKTTDKYEKVFQTTTCYFNKSPLLFKI